MRRLVSALGTACCASALALTGCGGDDAGSPLDEALGYLPADAPFVAAIETDVNGGQYRSLDRILERFPFSEQLKRGLQREIMGGGGLSYEQDVKPILGNEFVVGALDARALGDGGGAQEDFVAALQARDKGKLEAVIDKQRSREVGEQSGAKLYESPDGNSTVAIEDDVLIVASSRRLLEQALEQRDKDDKLTEEGFDAALQDLPGDALVRAYFDVAGLLEADPEARQARRIEWVKALRKLGITGLVRDDALKVDFRLGTEGDLADADLPLATGGGAPRVFRRAEEIGIGIRDLSQVVEFGESAAQAADPSAYGDYAAAKRQLEQRLGVDIDDDLVGRLDGDTALSVAVDGKFGWRTELDDPDAFERTLSKVADAVPGFLESTGADGVRLERPARPGGLYELHRSGEDTAYFAVIDEVFVIANDPGRARDLAAAAPSEVPGASGALVLAADAEKVATAALARLAPQLGSGGALGGGLFTGPLGDLTGSVRSSKDALSGSFELKIDG